MLMILVLTIKLCNFIIYNQRQQYIDESETKQDCILTVFILYMTFFAPPHPKNKEESVMICSDLILNIYMSCIQCINFMSEKVI